jgi:hypothetical protein
VLPTKNLYDGSAIAAIGWDNVIRVYYQKVDNSIQELQYYGDELGNVDKWQPGHNFTDSNPYPGTPIAVTGFNSESGWSRIYYQGFEGQLVELAHYWKWRSTNLDVLIPPGAGFTAISWLDDENDERRTRIYYPEDGVVKELQYNTSTKWVYPPGTPKTDDGISGVATGNPKAVAGLIYYSGGDQIRIVYVGDDENLAELASPSGGKHWSIGPVTGVYLK